MRMGDYTKMSTNDLYGRIVQGRGKLEKLVERLPGFGGYMEMNARRQADTIIRDKVARELKRQLEGLVDAEKALLDAGGLKYMSKTRSVKTKFQTLIDRIATDSPGYSGFFDAVKVGPDDLQVVYAFDEAMLDYGTKFAEKLGALRTAAASGSGVEVAIAELDALSVEANLAYDMREDVLKGLQ